MEKRSMNLRGWQSFGAAAALVVFVSGCTTVNPYTREEQTSKAAKGAGIGAAAGAVVGLLTKGDKLQNALIGAGVGAIAGGGARLDIQASTTLHHEIVQNGRTVVEPASSTCSV